MQYHPSIIIVRCVFFFALWNLCRVKRAPKKTPPGAVQVEHTQLHTVIQVDHRALSMRSKTAPQHEHLWRLIEGSFVEDIQAAWRLRNS